MAKTVRTTDSSGELVLRRDSYAYAFDGGTNVQYLVFARAKYAAYNGNQTITLLVTGIDNYAYSNIGVYILQGSIKANGATTGNAKAIIPGRNAANIGFGYYRGDDGYVYFGAKRVATYSQRTNITILHETGNPYPYEFEQFYAGATEPTGWTEVPLSGNLSNVIQTPAVVNVASIAALKTQMSTWYTEQGANSVGFYNVAFTAAASPFSAGARVNIQINAAANANNGVATLTYYGASSPEMYLMRLYNGTWGDPKKVTSAT